MARWIACALLILSTGCVNSILLTPCHYDPPFSESIIYDADCRHCRSKIAIIDVSGMIVNARTPGLLGGASDNPVSAFREKLDKAAADKRVKAVVLRINTPGGAVTASDIMYQDVLKFRAATHKPVIACMMDVATSGGYYLAMACDKVYAHPTTVTGSIGVIMNLYNAAGLFQTMGVTSEPIKSGPNKDLGNPLRPMSKEEREILQGMVDGFYNQFLTVVAEGRHLPVERVRALADGRIYSGCEAKKLGLVDELGYLDDAVQAAMDMSCICDAAIVAYDRCAGCRGSVYAMPNIPSEINVKLDLPGLGKEASAAFLYLWQPGVSH